MHIKNFFNEKEPDEKGNMQNQTNQKISRHIKQHI